MSAVSAIDVVVQHAPKRNPRRAQRAAASISVQRHYAPDHARQVKALLRLLESCRQEPVKGLHGEDVSQRGESLTKLGGNPLATT